MPKIRILLLPILLFLLGGCAMLDVSLLEDALPRERGDWGIQPYYSTGIPTWITTTSNQPTSRASAANDTGTIILAYLISATAVGAKVGYYVQPNTQITGRAYISGIDQGVGAKLGVKQVLSHYTTIAGEGELPGQTFLAVQPSVILLLPGLANLNPSEGEVTYEEISSVGGEIQFLLSNFKDPTRVTTLGFRPSYEHYWVYQPWDGDVWQDNSFRLGFTVNTGIPTGKVTLVPGCGIDLWIDQELGGFACWPYISLGVKIGH